MKKFLIYLCLFIFICFILPALLTKQDMKANSSDIAKQAPIDMTNQEDKNNAESKTDMDKNNTTIQLLHQKTGEIEEVELEKYLCNVVSAEMPASFEKEALKAQAVVARTYLIYQIINSCFLY